MNERIRELAAQAGIDPESDTLCRYEGWSEPIERFASLVAAAEREACAKVCELLEDDGGEWDVQQQCANAIRARGEK